MSVRKNQIHTRALAKAKGKRTHADKQQERYIRKKPLTPAQQRAQDAHKERTEAKALTETEDQD